MSDIFELFAKIEKDGGTASAAPKKAVEWIVAGLGNPGRDYERTRHNAGFLGMDIIARRCGVRCDRSKFHALTAQTEISGHGVLLMLPQTFMNASGEAVREAAAFYKIAPDHILVLVDDIYLDVGRLRVRKNGSAGGHNGLKSIIYQMNSDAFPRIRVGVGAKPFADMPLMDWVLSRFSDEEMKKLESALNTAADGVEMILNGKFDEAMQHCNSKQA
ncbi:MAG: aminoacyl-tRNA hydrolase [Clostridia bacterium]|nr:aminoacyl-tRNA hydrolase [Clostridia bacterium]